MASACRTIRTAASAADRLVPLLSPPRRPRPLFAAAPLAPAAGPRPAARPLPPSSGARLLSSTPGGGGAQRPAQDADGTRDEAIRAPLVEVYDESGALRGKASPKSVLSRINRNTHMLVVVKRLSSPEARAPPAVQVVSKAKYRADEQDRRKWMKEERSLEPKEKTLTVSAGCGIADLGHKAKWMRASLEKGDHVRVAIDPPRRKTFGGKQPSAQQVEELNAGIWGYLQKEWEDVAKMGRITAGKKGGQAALFIPHVSKRDIHEQNEQNERNQQDEQNERNQQDEQNEHSEQNVQNEQNKKR